MSKYGKPFCTDKEAAKLFKKYRKKDPFPSIDSSLLNSADIDDYVKATGMIWPYYSPGPMKGASYEAQIGDKAVYWDEKKRKCEVDLSEGRSVIIKPNSLIFLVTKQKFRLPDYIAIRFNLRITNVHRGLLLGTGPLVDPGFEGRLIVPLHNFTTNPYKFRGGEAFIWIEFTKISQNSRWSKNGKDRLLDAFPRKGEYKKFRPDPNSGFDHYFDEASPHSPIRSAIPAVLEKAEEAKRTVTSIRNWGLFSIAAAILATAYGLIPIFNNFSDLAISSTDLVVGVETEFERIRDRREEAEQQLISFETGFAKDVRKELNALVQQNEELQTQVSEFQERNEALQKMIEANQERIDTLSDTIPSEAERE